MTEAETILVGVNGLGQAAPTLTDASKNADLLVVGRRGHGGFLNS